MSVKKALKVQVRYLMSPRPSKSEKRFKKRVNANQIENQPCEKKRSHSTMSQLTLDGLLTIDKRLKQIQITQERDPRKEIAQKQVTERVERRFQRGMRNRTPIKQPEISPNKFENCFNETPNFYQQEESSTEQILIEESQQIRDKVYHILGRELDYSTSQLRDFWKNMAQAMEDTQMETPGIQEIADTVL
jgi:hypothetical protein